MAVDRDKATEALSTAGQPGGSEEQGRYRRMIRMVAGAEEGVPVQVPREDPPPTIDILVPVHDEWHVLRPCLEALDAFTTWPGVTLTILDDGCCGFVQRAMAAFAARKGGLPTRILRNETAGGFVQNANRGFREFRGDMALLLNSDTLVTPGWLDRLVEAVQADERVACAMPMSNQASFHSLDVPMGWNIFQYAADLGRRMRRTSFDAVTVGGFCVLFKRSALDDIGLFDEAFGLGYGEESDWCMRARSKGWRVVGVEDAFVYHRGKTSFKGHKDETFRHGNYERFMKRWGRDYKVAMAKYLETDALRPVRDAYVRMDTSSAPPVVSAFFDRYRLGGSVFALQETGRYIRDHGGMGQVPKLVARRGLLRKRENPHPMPVGFQSHARPRVVYVLEKFSVSGGVLSVVQLVNRLTLLGWDAKIATHHDHDQSLLDGYLLYHKPYVFPSAEHMQRHFPETDLVVATLWSTAHKIHRARTEFGLAARPWYFVQDDETRFFSPRDSEGRRQVTDSYALIPDRIVKSDWLRELLVARGHDAHKLPLGLDLDIFHVEDPARPRPLRVLGMARPRTPRRGFEVLVQTMRRLKALRPEVEVGFYGCEDLGPYGLDFAHTNLGLIEPDRLRSLYNDALVLVDSSEFQGFGRMGLEAMACGCAAVLTREGGIQEYARHEQNCLTIDPFDVEGIVSSVLTLLDDQPLRERLVAEGLRTAARFSCDQEARLTSELFARSLGIACDPETGAVTLPEGWSRDDVRAVLP